MLLADLQEIRRILEPYKLRPDDVFVIGPQGTGVDIISKSEFDIILSKYFEVESVVNVASTQKNL